MPHPTSRVLLSTPLLAAILLTGCPPDANNGPEPVDMTMDQGPADMPRDMPRDDGQPDADMDQGVDMGPCGVCDDGTVCDPSDTTCVQCINDDHCSGNTNVCDTEARTCVQCTTNDHCSANTSVCNPITNACVGCLSSTDCSGDLGVCDTENTTCVQCLDNASCTDTTASACRDNTCKTCQNHDDCAHLSDTPSCNNGTCVACTTDTEDSACLKDIAGEMTVFSCNPATNTCSDTEKGSVNECGACNSDSDCNTAAQYFCVPMTFQGNTLPGGYCLQKAPQNGGCSRPNTTELTGKTSLGGEMGVFCGLDEQFATCESFGAYLNEISCTDASVCGQGGLCKNTLALGRVCSIQCSKDDECNGKPCEPDTVNVGTKTCGEAP